MRCLYCHNPDTHAPSAGLEMTARQVVDKIARLRAYLVPRGGVTLSGGEPLMQPVFAAEILQGCRELGLHTAIDTAGFYSGPDIDRCLRATDLVILDIKHTDPVRHRELTGADIARPLEFLRRVTELGVALWVRQVIVPGWNDTPADMRALADILKPARTLQKVELLAYHSMARAKWQALGLDYPLADTPEPSGDDVRRLQTMLDAMLGG